MAQTVKYANFDLASGDNDGSSKANAWRTFQAAADGAAAGTDVCCTGTDTITSTVDHDTNTGTGTAPIRFIAYDATLTTPTKNGAVIDGNGAVNKLLNITTAGNLEFVGMEFKGSTAVGIDATNGASFILTDCYVHNNATYQIDAVANTIVIRRCKFAVGTVGIYRPDSNTLIEGCYFTALTTYAISLANTAFNTIVKNIFHACQIAISFSGASPSHIEDNTIDSCVSHGIDIATAGTKPANSPKIIGNRITNCGGYGINAAANTPAWLSHNSFYNNTSGAKNLTGYNFTDIPDITMTADWYTNLAGDDFTPKSGDEGIATVPMGGTGGTSSKVITGAIQPAAASGGGFIQCGSGRFGVMEG